MHPVIIIETAWSLWTWLLVTVDLAIGHCGLGYWSLWTWLLGRYYVLRNVLLALVVFVSDIEQLSSIFLILSVWPLIIS